MKYLDYIPPLLTALTQNKLNVLQCNNPGSSSLIVFFLLHPSYPDLAIRCAKHTSFANVVRLVPTPWDVLLDSCIAHHFTLERDVFLINLYKIVSTHTMHVFYILFLPPRM